MRFSEIIKNSLIIGASVMALQGCNAVTEDPGPCPGKNTFSISFKMLTSDPLQETRVDNEPNHSEADSEYRDLEDGINRSDLGLFIFAKAPEGSDEKLILKLTNIGTSTNPQMMITGSPGAYTITMSLNKNDFSEKLRYEVTPDGERQIQFRVLILANCNVANLGNITADTFSGVIDQAKAFSFAMSNLYNNNEGDSGVTGLYKGNIPMFGTNVFQVREIDLWSSKAEERIYLGEVDMLRALAKVRVVDNIQNKNDEGYPKITQVEFIGSQGTAFSLPTDAVNYINGNQVHTPNIYNTEVSFNGDFNKYTYKLGTIAEGWDMTPADNRKGQTRIGYVPEQTITYLNGNVAEGFPIIKITAAIRKDPSGNDEIKEYNIPMKGKYEDQEFNFGNQILRNHIYTLSVNKIAVGTPANISIDITDWTTNDVNLDYTETVTVSPRITWIKGTYESLNKNNGYVYVKPWTADNKPVLLQATFKIRTPENAVWTAYLIQKEGNSNDAFMFTDKNGENETPTVSETVSKTGDETTLYIKPTIQNPVELNSAILQVVVTLGNGTTIEVPLVPSDINGKNFTIVQQKNN